MRLPHHLVRSATGVFHFRLKVPRDLRAALTLRVIKKSLHTRDPNVARVYSHALSLHYALAFAAHRGTAVPKPPEIDVAEVLARVGRGAGRRYEVSLDPVRRTITSLKTDGTAADHAAAMQAVKAMQAQAVPADAPPESSMTMEQAVLTYTMTEAKALKPNTWEQRRRALNAFQKAVGGTTNISAITRREARTWAHSLMTDQGMSKRTAANNVSHVAQLFEKLITWGETTTNPVKGTVVMSKKEKAARKAEGFQWEPFDLADLKRIYDPANLVRARTDHVRWGALIGLYTGARVGEIAQMFLRDFVVEEGTPCVKITVDSDGQTLKTNASHRLVPLHPDLIRLGLLERVERLRAANEERLFPDMRIDSKAGTGNALSKGFAYYIGTVLKLKARRKNGTVGFHSLRKNVIQKLQGSRLLGERRRAFVGHEQGDGDVHEEVYMRAWSTQELTELFPGLSWGEWLDVEGLRGLLG